MPASFKQSFFNDWQASIFCRQCKASSSSLAQCESRSTSIFSAAIETDKVLSPLAVMSRLRNSSTLRLMRYLENAMLLSALSVIRLFFCLMLLLRTSVSRERLFSLSLNSSTPISLIWQSSRKRCFSLVQCLERPYEQSVLLVILCQLMLKFNDYNSPQASDFRKQLMPSSSTEVACRSSLFMCRMHADSAKITSPSLEISELPQSISCYNLPSHKHFEISTSESSVI